MVNLKSTIRNPHSARRAISLLEVLVSMFVLIVGLLGIVSLLPVGAHFVGMAKQQDASVAVGQAAFHDIMTRGLLNCPEFDAAGVQVDGWVQPNGNKFQRGTTFPSGYSIPNDASDARGFAFAIDPAGCAVNSSNAVYFPAASSAGPTLPLPRATFLLADDVTPMSLPMAEAIFMSHDDLSTELPDDRDEPATQLYQNDGAGVPIQRQYHGDFSWMFTAVPHAVDSDLYTVSVVVFYKRRLVDTTLLGQDDVPERMVQTDSTPTTAGADGFVFGGVGSVETSLHASTKEHLERIRPGEWVMLSAATTSGNIYKWFRIISIDNEIVGTGPYTRWVSLAGPDWDTDLTTYVSLFEGAIAVYEKTMRLEGSTLYSIE